MCVCVCVCGVVWGRGSVFERLFYHSGMTLMFRFELLQATVNAIDSSVLKPAATTGEFI